MWVSRVKVGQAIWNHVPPESLPTILRWALGIIFITGGTNLTFAPDPVSLAQSYPNPAKGWIFPNFVDVIANGLGMDVGAFLGIHLSPQRSWLGGDR